MSHGAASPADRPRHHRARRQAARLGANVAEGWNGFARAAQRGRPRRRPRYRASCRMTAASLGRPDRPCAARASSTCCSCSAPTRYDTTRHGQGVRRLCRHAWRCRRPPRRRDPAGRDLHREVGHLCQHRGPRAARRARRVPARRAPRKTGRFSVPCRPCWASRCRSTRWPSCAPRSMPSIPHLARLDQIAAELDRRCEEARRRGDQDQVGDLHARRSPTSTSPTRSRARPRRWGNAQPSRLASSRPRSKEPRWISSFPALDYLLGIPIFGWGTQVGFVCKALLLLVALLIFIAYILLRRPQDLGGGAARRGPNVGRPVRLAAVLRRPVEIRASSEPVDPGGLEQGRVPAGAAGDRDPWPSRPRR